MLRCATQADFPRLVELGRAMHDESSYASMPFDPAVLTNTLAFVREKGFICVNEKDGHIDAVMVAVLSPSWFGPGLTASDLALYVEPAARGGTAAYRLIEAFIRWAESKGVHAMYLGVTTGVHPEQTGRLYERLGFRPVGGFYMRK
jgi:GNAT superfamily N-acetyltransferase